MLTVMRITVLLCLLGVLQVTASNTYSQEARISLNVKDAVVSDVLREIEEKSEFFFLYNNKLIDVDRVVDVDVKSKSITKVLDLLFADKVQRNISDRQIVLSPVVKQDQSLRKGIVLSAENGSGLPGVSVVIKGTTIGTSTNIDGDFSIKANVGDVLVFSFMGMENQEFKVVNNVLIKIKLNPNALNIDEVVVVAYGVQKKSEITGSISTVSADEIASVPMPTIDKALQGRVSGVFIQSNSGNPGAATQIRIRGTSSLGAGNQPLFVVDGVPQNVDKTNSFSSSGSMSPLTTIPASDIASVSVLKDAAAMAIYGSRAANGVILITTKSGENGKTKYQFNTRFGISKLPEGDFKKLSATDELMLKREGVKNVGGNPDEIYPMSLLDNTGDWMDAIFRTAKTQEHSFSARGGNEKTTFYASLSYLDQEGIVLGSDINRISSRINLDHKAGEYITFGFKTGFTKSKTHNIITSGYAYENPFRAALSISELEPIKNTDGTWNVDIPSVGGFMNPVALSEVNTRKSDVFTIKNNAYFNVKFLNDFNFKTDFSYDISNIDDIEVYNPPFTWDDGGARMESKGLTENWSYKSILTYSKSINEVHNFNAMAGYEVEKYNYNYLNANGTKINSDISYFVPGIDNLKVNSNDLEYAFSGLFSKFSYNYNSKYYVAFSFRRDGSSRFGEDKRFANFGSVSASWRLTSEDFIKDIEWLDDLKIRSSYGTSGNSNIKNYEARGTYNVAEYNHNAGLFPSRRTNNLLTWEKNAQFDLGIDFSVLGRIHGSFDVYKRKSDDMLMDVPLSYTTGFKEAKMNTASMENKGFDLELRTVNLDGELHWESSFMFSYTENEVTSLPNGNIMDGSYPTIVGESADIFAPFAYAGVDPSTGKEMFWHIEYAKNENGVIDYRKELSRNITYDPAQASRHIAGLLSPKYTGSIDNSFSYKGFELNFMFSFVQGNKISAGDNFFLMHDGRESGGLFSPALDRWQKPGDKTDIPKFVYGNTSPYTWHDRNVSNGSYLRLRSAMLAYNLNSSLCKKIRCSSLKFYIQGTNLYTWHNADSFDPDRPTAGGFRYPNPRSFSAGINLTF